MPVKTSQLGRSAAGAKPISFWQLIFLTTAFFASIRRIPNLAIAGWEAIAFMAFAVIMFVLPVSFVSAQLATAMPSDGGLAVWLGGTLSPRWGFAGAFLVWVQMCFGMVTVGAAFADMLATIFNRPALLQNNLFIGVVAIVLFWLITLLIIAGAPITAISTWGMVFGLVLPLGVLLVLGTLHAATGGLFAAAPPTAADILPNFTNLGTFANLSGIIFLFAGMEQASNYANRIQNPRKTYPKALVSAALLTAVLFSFAGILVYIIVPAGTIELADPAQVFAILFNALGAPWLTNLIAAMIALSCITELAAWVSGPSRGLLQSARAGILPAVFAKTNRHDIPVPLLLLQALLVTAIALVFVFIPGTNAVFGMVLTMAVAIYVVVYLLILIAGIRLRATGGAKNAFQLPGGKVGAVVFTALGFIGLAVVFLASLIPPDTLTGTLRGPYPFIILGGTALFTCIPLVLYQFSRAAKRAHLAQQAPANPIQKETLYHG